MLESLAPRASAELNCRWFLLHPRLRDSRCSDAKDTDLAFTYELPVERTPFTTNYPGTVDWSTVREGFWVGRFDGRLCGVIEERWTGAFIANGRDAKPIGLFATLWDAQAAFEND